VKLRYTTDKGPIVSEVAAVFDHDGHTYAVLIGNAWDNCGPLERRTLQIADLTFCAETYGAVLEPS
jgi:hypothetical protein